MVFPRRGRGAVGSRRAIAADGDQSDATARHRCRQPTAFWWKMPDGRRLFVWLGDHYTRGFYYFYADTWRRGPVPESTDTRYRPARPGELFAVGRSIGAGRARTRCLSELQDARSGRLHVPARHRPGHQRMADGQRSSRSRHGRVRGDLAAAGTAAAAAHGDGGRRAAADAGRDRRPDSRTDGRVARLVGQWRGLRPPRSGRQSPRQATGRRSRLAGLGTAGRARRSRPPTTSCATCACSTNTRGVPATVLASRTASRRGPNTTRSRATRTAPWPWPNCCWRSVRAPRSTRAKKACTWPTRRAGPGAVGS